MITSVRFRSFKGLRRADLELERLTVLVGPNASGKTSVLEGLHHLSRLASADPRDVFQGPAALGLVASRGAEGALELALAGSFRGRRGSLALSFPAVEDYPFSSTYTLEAQWGDKQRTVTGELQGDGGAGHGELPLASVLREAAWLALDPKKLAEPCFSELPTPALAPDGAGLAAVIADMALTRPDDFLRLQDAVRAVIPGLVRVRLIRSRVARRAGSIDIGAIGELGAGRRPPPERWGHEIVLDLQGARDLPARLASEGTLVVLGLFAALLGPERHHLVLVDHLDRAIGPRAAAPFARELNEILRADAKLQLVATCDAPFLIDHVEPEEIRVHAVLPDGSAAVAPLASHPDFAMLRSDLRPGEFWSTVGESWVEAALRPPSPAPRAPAPAHSPSPALSRSPAPTRAAPAPIPPARPSRPRRR